MKNPYVVRSTSNVLFLPEYKVKRLVRKMTISLDKNKRFFPITFHVFLCLLFIAKFINGILLYRAEQKMQKLKLVEVEPFKVQLQ